MEKRHAPSHGGHIESRTTRGDVSWPVVVCYLFHIVNYCDILSGHLDNAAQQYNRYLLLTGHSILYCNRKICPKSDKTLRLHAKVFSVFKALKCLFLPLNCNILFARTIQWMFACFYIAVSCTWTLEHLSCWRNNNFLCDLII